MGSILSMVSQAVGAHAQIYQTWMNSKAQSTDLKRQSAIEQANIMRQANAQAEAQKAAARAYERQSAMDLMESGQMQQTASEELRGAETAQQQANIEQIKGEREAARRSRQLAQEIGSQYAQFAGNGLLVDASPTDTFGSIIRSSATEGQADISTILDNAKMEQWNYEERKRALRAGAANSLAGANNAVLKSQSDAESAKDAYSAADRTMADAAAAAADVKKMYDRQRHNLRKQAWRSMIATYVSAGAQSANAWYGSGGSKNLWGQNGSAKAGW